MTDLRTTTHSLMNDDLEARVRRLEGKVSEIGFVFLLTLGVLLAVLGWIWWGAWQE